jgi:3-oxoacyl-[acyl-carrier-protein] synthase III
VFDVVNACAGMFTGIYVLQGMIRSGMARCGLVVSGEQNFPLAETAARELRHSFDGQLAALTLGDGGAALILDRSPDPHFGFQRIDLVTGAKHDHYCYSRPSRRGRGGILVTKARGLQRKGNEHFPAYFKRALDTTGWAMDDLQHIIPHQVSVRAIENGVRAVSRYLECALPDITRCSADHYGNTSTTSHFLAVHDAILQGRIQNGHNAMLVSGASGIVIAHATYTFDDLPQRYRARFSGVS